MKTFCKINLQELSKSQLKSNFQKIFPSQLVKQNSSQISESSKSQLSQSTLFNQRKYLNLIQKPNKFGQTRNFSTILNNINPESQGQYYKQQSKPNFLSTQLGQIDILKSDSNDIIFNLATEEYIFEHCDVRNPVLFLWRNSPTIIIGKHQNPWKECRVQLLQQNNITLARRKSGGGCVYQDLGNSVFSFINPIQKEMDFKTMNNDILISGLQEHFGIKAKASGRNDLIVEHQNLEKKISGSAYKLRIGNTQTGEGRRSLHHGTMLLNLELNALQKYLNPSKAKLQSKGISSVISRVINLQELNPQINHDSFCSAIQQQFTKKHENFKINIHELDQTQLKEIPKLQEIYQETSSWDWRFGQSPQFTNNIEHKFPWALVDLHFDVEGGRITKGKCYSDCLVPSLIESLNGILERGNIKYDVSGIKDICQELRLQNPQEIKLIDEFQQWLVQAI